jgi:hypothetical protein
MSHTFYFPQLIPGHFVWSTLPIHGNSCPGAIRYLMTYGYERDDPGSTGGVGLIQTRNDDQCRVVELWRISDEGVDVGQDAVVDGRSGFTEM